MVGTRLAPRPSVSARETWQSLQRHLSAARGFLEAGDHARALDEADAALAIDSQFLAAQSLRERILAAGAHDGPACRSAPPLTAPPVTHGDPLADFPLRPAATPRPPAPETGRTNFKARATQRRVERRLDAARAAIVERRPHDAAVALDKVLDLDPHAPELPALTAALGHLPRTPPAPRRGAWLVATIVFAATIFGASWLEENQLALISHPFLAISRMVAPPAPQPEARPDTVAAVPPDAAPAGELDREPAPESPPAGTSGRTALSPSASSSTMAAPTSPPALNPTTMVPAEVRAPARSIEPPAPSVTTAPAPAVTTPAPPVTEPAPIPIAPQSLPAALPAADVPSTRPPEGSPAAVPEVDDGALVRQALHRYREAYDGLDAGSAQAVWPAVDEGALARAFDGLASQKLTFEECRVQLQRESAVATCRGTTRYVPKVGSREPRTEPRVWNFVLRKSGGEWKIESARVAR